MRTEEKNYSDILFLPLLQAITESLGEQFSYEHREALLMSMTQLLMQRNIIKRKSEGYKADGIVRFGRDEVFLVEICGFFGNTLKSKIQFDRHKAAYGLLAMLKCTANKYEYGHAETFQKLEIIRISGAREKKLPHV